MRILILGGNGGLGIEVAHFLEEDKRDTYTVSTPRSTQVDVRISNEIFEYIVQAPPDALLYMAGITRPGLLHKEVNQSIKSELEINALGFVNAVNAVLPRMRKHGWGRIIYVSSVLAVRPIKGTAGYSASKCYGESIVRSVALENATKGVTANTIRMGYTNRGMISQVPPTILEQVIDKIPVKRLGDPLELYKTIIYVLNNSFLTGATIDVSGGLHI